MVVSILAYFRVLGRFKSHRKRTNGNIWIFRCFTRRVGQELSFDYDTGTSAIAVEVSFLLEAQNPAGGDVR